MLCPRIFLTMTQDCYSILGIPRTATVDEIRLAYRRLVRLYHPDLNSGPEAESRMQQINEAYSTLSDPQRRRQYDLGSLGIGTAARRYNRGSVNRTRQRAARGGGDLRDARAGEDLKVSVFINPREARLGTRKSFWIERLEACPRCRGTGTEPEETLTAGACWRCAGKQRIPRELRLQATMPAGVADGARLRLRGQGCAGINGGPHGHVYITARLSKSSGIAHTFTFLMRHLFH